MGFRRSWQEVSLASIVFYRGCSAFVSDETVFSKVDDVYDQNIEEDLIDILLGIKLSIRRRFRMKLLSR